MVERIWVTWDKHKPKPFLQLLHKIGISLHGAVCYSCGKKIYWRKLGGIIPGKNGKPIFICGNSGCMMITLIEDDVYDGLLPPEEEEIE